MTTNLYCRNDDTGIDNDNGFKIIKFCYQQSKITGYFCHK